MGGPLATAPTQAGEFHGAYYTFHLTQVDQKAPLHEWKKAKVFQSKQDCEDYKAGQLKKLDDPQTYAQMALKTRMRLVDRPHVRQFVESERCASAAEASPR